jgi:hypothetical protein
MPTRVLLAILILTNPVCCQTVESAGNVRPEEPVAQCSGCGGACSQREQPHSPGDPREVPPLPLDCPNCELCQCVCAGALVTGNVTLPEPDGGTAIDVISDRPAETPSLLDFPGCSCETPMARGEANVGRTARIRHASLLC